jgi:hypothetical protein
LKKKKKIKKKIKIRLKKVHKAWWSGKWGKEHQVREKRIKLQLIKLVEDVETTHIIVEKDFVQVVALEELPNYDNLVGEIDTVLLMVIKDFIDKGDLLVSI